MRQTIERLACSALGLLLASAIATAGNPPVAPGDTAWRPGSDDEVPRIRLWPDPDAFTATGRIIERSSDPSRPDRFIDNMRAPYLAVYAPDTSSGVALLVAPGGGYARVVLDKEGTALIPAFVEDAGITLFVLRYRLPGGDYAAGPDAPLADAQRAMRLIRAHAAEWQVDPDQIGVMGFSAGGHVAARLATTDDAVYAPIDAADTQSLRPDFALLVYPVISMQSAIAHAGSRLQLLGAHPTPEQVHAYSPQQHVDADTPPLFLLHAQDDAVVPATNSLVLHAAAMRAGVPASLHVFPHGGHGFGTRDATGALASWPRLAIDWIKEQHHP